MVPVTLPDVTAADLRLMLQAERQGYECRLRRPGRGCGTGVCLAALLGLLVFVLFVLALTARFSPAGHLWLQPTLASHSLRATQPLALPLSHRSDVPSRPHRSEPWMAGAHLGVGPLASMGPAVVEAILPFALPAWAAVTLVSLASAAAVAYLQSSRPLPSVSVPAPAMEPPRGLAPGEVYFTGCVTCQRAWNKPADGPTARPWRGEAYSALDCGEDSFCLTAQVLGVADGVGGWRLRGVDPGIFADRLMEEVKDQAVSAGPGDPVQMMDTAYKSTLKLVQYGSATCCVASLQPNGVLRVANLGDSGLLVIRDGQCVHRTETQQFQFNFPLQLSTHVSPGMTPTKPTDSGVTEVQVQAGDIVVLATDGLLDNVYETDIVQMITAQLQAGLTLPQIATALFQTALDRTRDRTYLSPFAAQARQVGFSYLGGKPDDITLLLAQVQAEA
eukprot:EG_transcript_8502